MSRLPGGRVLAKYYSNLSKLTHNLSIFCTQNAYSDLERLGYSELHPTAWPMNHGAYEFAPGGRYLVVSTEKLDALPEEHVREIDLQCEGIYGVSIDIPPAFTPDWEEALNRLGLGQAKTIEVWPAGLTAVMWGRRGGVANGLHLSGRV